MIHKSDSNGLFLVKLTRWQVGEIEDLIDRHLFRDRFGVQAVADGVGCNHIVDLAVRRFDAAQDYTLRPGMAHIYNEGDVHSSRRVATRVL
jgi:hypothetical protein